MTPAKTRMAKKRQLDREKGLVDVTVRIHTSRKQELREFAANLKEPTESGERK